jgi:hypothetical protein
MQNGSAEPYFSSEDFGSSEMGDDKLVTGRCLCGSVRYYVKATSGRRTIAIAKIADDALGASMSLFGLTLAASKSLLEAQEGLPSKPTTAIS